MCFVSSSLLVAAGTFSRLAVGGDALTRRTVLLFVQCASLAGATRRCSRAAK